MLGLSLNTIYNTIRVKASGLVRKGLEMFLPFSKNGEDISGEGNHATLYTGKALSFNGTTDVLDFSAITLSGDFTIAFWIKPLTFNAADEGIMSSRSAYAISYRGDTGEWKFNIDGTWYTKATTATLALNSWNRVVITRVGADINVDVNDTLSDSFTTVASDFKVESIAKYATNYLHAEFSDFQIFDTAWTQDDVTFDYNNPQHLVTEAPLREEILGEEEIIRGDFPEESNGTLTSSSYGLGFASDSVDSTITINDGKLTIVNQPSSNNDRGKLEFSNSSLNGKFLPEIGKTYKLEYNIDSLIGNPSLTLFKGGTYVSDLTENIGDNTYTFTAGNNVNFLFRNNTDDSTVVFNSISLKEVTQSSSLSEELVDNSDFELGDNGDWTIEAVWTITGGAANGNGANGSSQQLIQSSVFTVGKTYKVTYDITNYVGGSVFMPNVGSSNSGNGTYSEYITATQGDFKITGTNFDGSIDNISVKEIVSPTLNNLKGYWHLSEGDGAINYDSSGEGNDGTIDGATWEDQQATIPQLGLMDWSKGSNLIEYSEDFSDSSWTKSDTTVTNNYIDPNGTQNASKATKDGDDANDRIKRSFTLSNTTDYSISAFIKNDDIVGVTTLGVRISGATLFRQGYEWDGSALSLASSYNSGTRTNVLLEDVGNGWWKIGYSFTSDGTSSNIEVDIDRANGTDTTSLFLWGVQLNEGSSATAYRRTNGTAVTDATLIADPNDPSEDILGNSVRLREHSLNLDGIGYAEVPDADNLDFGTGDFSLECWAKYSFLHQGSGWNVILSNGSMSSGGSGFNLGTNSDEFAIRLNDGSSETEYIGSNLTEGQWYHIVITRDGTSLKTYLDTSESTHTIAAIDVTTSQDIRIGRDTNSDRYYQDLIDDVRIYNRALSSEEISQNYNYGITKHKNESAYSDDYSSDYGY